MHTETDGKISIKYQSTKLWNNLQQLLQIDLLQGGTRSKPGGTQEKLISEHFFNNYNWATENYTRQLKIIPMRILRHKSIQFAQTYNTFKHGIWNYKEVSLLYIAASTITCIMNTPFPSLFLLPSPFPNTWYSSSSTTHQYNNNNSNNNNNK